MKKTHTAQQKTRRKLVAKPIPDSKRINFDWKPYLKPAFTELVRNGIVAFATPFNTGGFIDDAWDAVETALLGLEECRRIAKKHWKIDLPAVRPSIGDANYEEVQELISHVPFMFYMTPSDTSSSVFIHHNIHTTEQADIVDAVMNSHFGKKYKWKRKSPENTIQVSCGIKVPKLTLEEIYDQETLDKLNEFAKKYPDAEFKRTWADGCHQWTSPKITQAEQDFNALRPRAEAAGLRWVDAKTHFRNHADILTPWVDPLTAERDVQEWVGYKREEIEEAERVKNGKEMVFEEDDSAE